MSEIAHDEMSDDDVFSALSEAAAQDVAAEQVEAPAAPVPAAPEVAPAPESGAPVEGVTPPVGQAPAAPLEPGVEQPTVEEFTPFNPDELPPELLPAWKQLQQAYTPRLQEAAAIRKQFEELGGNERIEQAMNLLNRVSDPQAWPELYEELYHAMSEAGFQFEDPALPPASVQPASTQSPFGQLADDPELAPLVQQLQSLNERTEHQQQLIEAFYHEQDARQQIAEEELRQANYLAGMQRQVMGIREANPHYDDNDIRDIIQMGTFFNDDLQLAAQAFEASFARRMDRYFAGKKNGVPAALTPPAGAGVLSTEEKEPETIEEAGEEAVELLRRLQASGELDLSDF